MTKMTKTNAQKQATKRAQEAVVWFDEMMNDLCDDPMTEAMGAPVSDFAEDWNRRHRRMLADCLKDPDNTPDTRQLLLDAFERYMP